jgi:acetyl-CoA carboxylase carboxyltransferase component
MNLQRLNPQEQKIVGQFGALTESSTTYWFGEEEYSRKYADGLMTFLVKSETGDYGIVYNDFKMNGGSFGQNPSSRVNEFIKYLGHHNTPLILMTNSLGARLMEGRNVFQDAFGIIPTLANFATKNLLVTVNMGRSLGIGALLYSMGHYRYTLKKDCVINLTGPEVIKMFFGKGYNFEEISSVERHQRNSSLVHEIFETKKALYQHLKNKVNFLNEPRQYQHYRRNNIDDIYKLETPDQRVEAIIDGVCEESFEVFDQLDGVVRTFICRRNGKLLGVFINPPGRPNNVINIRTMEKYQAALDLFKVLKLPIVSFMDTPGASPLNFIDSKKEVVIMLKDTASKIISYPYGKMGFCVGRGFGGATVLGFPKVFGGLFQFILKGSQVGIMHHSIIEKLLHKSERLLGQWRKTSANEPEDYSDIIAKGTIDAVIEYSEINSKIDIFQKICHGEEKLAEYTTRASYANTKLNRKNEADILPLQSNKNQLNRQI